MLRVFSTNQLQKVWLIYRFDIKFVYLISVILDFSHHFHHFLGCFPSFFPNLPSYVIPFTMLAHRNRPKAPDLKQSRPVGFPPPRYPSRRRSCPQKAAKEET